MTNFHRSDFEFYFDLVASAKWIETLERKENKLVNFLILMHFNQAAADEVQESNNEIFCKNERRFQMWEWKFEKFLAKWRWCRREKNILASNYIWKNHIVNIPLSLLFLLACLKTTFLLFARKWFNSSREHSQTWKFLSKKMCRRNEDDFRVSLALLSLSTSFHIVHTVLFWLACSYVHKC